MTFIEFTTQWKGNNGIAQKHSNLESMTMPLFDGWTKMANTITEVGLGGRLWKTKRLSK